MSRKPQASALRPASYLAPYHHEYVTVGFGRRHFPLIETKDEAARLAESHIGFAVAVQVDAVSFSAGCRATYIYLARHTPQNRREPIGRKLKAPAYALGVRVARAARINESLVDRLLSRDPYRAQPAVRAAEWSFVRSEPGSGLKRDEVLFVRALPISGPRDVWR